MIDMMKRRKCALVSRNPMRNIVGSGLLGGLDLDRAVVRVVVLSEDGEDVVIGRVVHVLRDRAVGKHEHAVGEARRARVV